MIKQKLQNEQIQALKSGNKEKVSFLRYILAQIKNLEIKKNLSTGQNLTDEEIILLLKKIAKELQDSINLFKKGGREDLIKAYNNQLNIINHYLPKEISDKELIEAIKKIVDTNLSSVKNPKMLIGLCIKELKSKADPSRIIKILNSLNLKS